ncbi:MAG: hypothetical protein O4861_10220 [Trichodesmium sp. St16_bin4-tuft]|nr:hypothetical protein [Trichodesmium sp. MAG_R01]MDE5070111.1 hypothetical protein [Trichodesmium sp. St4_bin8_1]MDE5071707.1 hypothetical protein [Trichodesmium sp. St5_bin8]MDE5079137.1 hypothetical protein [Trichodesmium sp. St2_bin6]MDE5092441.1 hypothetical protein [Trichodesmium sp. St18_bin3_1_1]MDE5098684.1 hypothetical protein [Trichodesmium sp. St16_bin4-tuft]MDE5101647.1 hypothetical protein [Trichodesmium sp. St19_bin2]
MNASDRGKSRVKFCASEDKLRFLGFGSQEPSAQTQQQKMLIGFLAHSFHTIS